MIVVDRCVGALPGCDDGFGSWWMTVDGIARRGACRCGSNMRIVGHNPGHPPALACAASLIRLISPGRVRRLAFPEIVRMGGRPADTRFNLQPRPRRHMHGLARDDGMAACTSWDGCGWSKSLPGLLVAKAGSMSPSGTPVPLWRARAEFRSEGTWTERSGVLFSSRRVVFVLIGE